MQLHLHGPTWSRLDQEGLMPHCIRWDSFDPLHFTWPHLDPNDGNEHYLDLLGCMCIRRAQLALTRSHWVTHGSTYSPTESQQHTMRWQCSASTMTCAEDLTVISPKTHHYQLEFHARPLKPSTGCQELVYLIELQPLSSVQMTEISVCIPACIVWDCIAISVYRYTYLYICIYIHIKIYVYIR